MPKIIDAFIFYNELDMLEFRLTELAPVVDYFVIVESTKTFADKPKPLYFSSNTDRYEKFISKIKTVIVQDMPTGNAWAREQHQRNCIIRGIKSLNLADNDIVIISDCDEIPDVDMLSRFKRTGLKGAKRPVQDFYYYNLNCRGRVGNSRCRIMDYRSYKTKSPEAHTKSSYPAVPQGGWHFSYFGSEDFIVNKIQQFSHQEFNNPKYTNKEIIEKRVRECSDLFARGGPGGPHQFYYLPLEQNKYLPKNYQLLLKFQNQHTKDKAISVESADTPTKALPSKLVNAAILLDPPNASSEAVSLESPNILSEAITSEPANAATPPELANTATSSETPIVPSEAISSEPANTATSSETPNVPSEAISSEPATADTSSEISNAPIEAISSEPATAATSSEISNAPIKAKPSKPAKTPIKAKHIKTKPAKTPIKARPVKTKPAKTVPAEPAVTPTKTIPAVSKNVIYYCIAQGKECFEDYIESLNIINCKVYYTKDSELDRALFTDPNNVHIFRYHLPQFLLQAKNEAIFVLNTEQLSEAARFTHISAIAKAGIKIIDYSLANIKILESKLGTTAHYFYLPYQYRDNEVKKLLQFSQNPKNDVGIVACHTEHRRQVLQQLIKAGIKAVDIRGWKDTRDRQIGYCKMLLNIHFDNKFKIFEHIRCDRWLFAGKKVLSEPVSNLELLDIADLVIFTLEVVKTVKEQLSTAQTSHPCSTAIIEGRRQYLYKVVEHINSISATNSKENVVKPTIPLPGKLKYKDCLENLCKDMAAHTNVVIVGKGPTAKYITQREPDTFYVGIKQSVQFLKDIDIDLFVLTDLSGFYGVENLLKKIRFILCPYYPHGYNFSPRHDIDYNYVSRYVAEHGFKGTLCFVQIATDISKHASLPVYKVSNSGDFFFHVCRSGLLNRNITTYGINRGVGYHPDMIKLVKSLNSKNAEQKKWSAIYLNNLQRGTAGMVQKSIYDRHQSHYQGRHKDLKIKHL